MKRIVILALIFCATVASVRAQNTDIPAIPATCKCSSGWHPATKDSIVSIPCLAKDGEVVRLIYNYRNCTAWFPFAIVGDLNTFREYIRGIRVGNIGDTAEKSAESMTYCLSIDFDSMVSSPQIRETTTDMFGYKKIQAVIRCIPSIASRSGDDTARTYKESRQVFLFTGMKFLALLKISDSVRMDTVSELNLGIELPRPRWLDTFETIPLLALRVLQWEKKSPPLPVIDPDIELARAFIIGQDYTRDEPQSDLLAPADTAIDTIVVIDPVTGLEKAYLIETRIKYPVAKTRNPKVEGDPIVAVDWKEPTYRFKVKLPKDLNFRRAGKSFLQQYRTSETGHTWIDSFVVKGYEDTLRVEPNKKYSIEVYLFSKKTVSVEEAFYYVALKPNTIPLGVSLSTLIANKTIALPNDAQNTLVRGAIPIISFGTPSTSTIDGESLFVTFFDDGAQFGHRIMKTSYDEALDNTYALVRLVGE